MAALRNIKVAVIVYCYNSWLHNEKNTVMGCTRYLEIIGAVEKAKFTSNDSETYENPFIQFISSICAWEPTERWILDGTKRTANNNETLMAKFTFKGVFIKKRFP